MGSLESDNNSWRDERPQHEVTVQEFKIGIYPITQEEWQEVMGTNPSYFRGENLPVDSVSWDEAMAFCARLTEMTGTKYRLPSEAEWEYVCRAGSTGDHSGELGLMAWYDANANNITHPVGQLEPNAWGVHDMHGNLWEWCEDAWHDNYEGAPSDGRAWLSEGDLSLRVLRGGSWDFNSSFCRSAFRNRDRAGDRSFYFGLRVACSY